MSATSIAWGMITVGLISSFLTINNTTSTGALNGSIVGYSFMCAGLIIIMATLLIHIKSNPADMAFYKAVPQGLVMLVNVGPLLMMFGLLAFLLNLFSLYKNRIVSGHVAPDYTYFMWLVYVLTSIFFLILYFEMNRVFSEATDKTKNPYAKGLALSKSMALALVTLITAMDIKTINNILYYFKTDG